jgi:hypothetical protein
MLNLSDFTQLACRASNLAERLIILKQLSEFKGSVALTEQDLQAVHQDLETLFPRSVLDANQQQGPFYRLKRKSMQRSLRHYRWIETNLNELSPQQHQVFAKVHAPWLPIYERAIAQVAQVTPNLTPNLLWKDSMQGCLPFLKLIETEVTAILDTVELEDINLSIHPGLVASVQQCFWQRVQMMVTDAMAASSSLSRVEGTVKRTEAFHEFYLHFPVLARWLAQISGDLMDLTRQVIAHLLQDCTEISQQFWDGVAITSIVNCRFVPSNEGMEEQPTLQVEFGLANGQTKRLNYYPFSLKAEVGLQQLYAVLSNPQTNIPLISILSKQGYGYIAYTQQTSERSTLEQFQGIGRYLAIRQLLGNHRGLWGKLQLGVAQEERSLEHPNLIPETTTIKDAIQCGFDSVDGWFRTQPQQAIHALNLYFSGATARLCHRPTATYLQLLKQVQAAEYLANPLAIEAVFRTLMEHPCPWDSLGELVQLEVKMLWQFKVLWLTVPMNHRYLLYEAEHALFTKLPLSPLDYLARRVQHIGSRRVSPNLNRNELNQNDKTVKECQSYP